MNLSEGVVIEVVLVVVIGVIVVVVIGTGLELAVFGCVRTSLMFRFAAGGARYLVRLRPR